MSTHVLRSSLALNAGGIAKIDALENEEEAQFSDDAESLVQTLLSGPTLTLLSSYSLSVEYRERK